MHYFYQIKKRNAEMNLLIISDGKNNYDNFFYIQKKYHNLIIFMSIRRGWTQQEDKILKHLKEERKVKKWSSIAKLMDYQFNICGRNGKQCRQRYHNHLEEGIVDNRLSFEQQKELERINVQIGNKWSVIAKFFKGRTSNYLKNTLYSKLRKSIRKINKFIKDSKIQEVKPFKLNIVFKIIESNDFKFFEKEHHSEEDLQFYAELRSNIFRYADQQQFPIENQYKAKQTDPVIQSCELMRNLVKFLRMYERLNKRAKRIKKRYFCQDDIILNSLSNNKISLGNLGKKQQHNFEMKLDQKLSKMDESGEQESGLTSFRKQLPKKRKKRGEEEFKVTQMYKVYEYGTAQMSKVNYPQTMQKSPNLSNNVALLQKATNANSDNVINQNNALPQEASFNNQNNNNQNEFLEQSQPSQYFGIQYLDHFKSFSFMDESLFQ